MYTNAMSATANWNYFSAQSGTAAAGGDFSSFFDSLKGGSGGNPLDAIMDRLAERFPGVSFNGKAPAAGAAEDADAAEDTKDSVAVDEQAAAEMSASEQFAAMVEKALSSFFDATRDQASGGNVMYRSVSITVTTIRMSVNQVDGASGEDMMSQELEAKLKERIDEMIRQFFGGEAAAKPTEETGKTDDDANDPAGGKNGMQWSGWSMQLFYSHSYLSGLSGQEGGGLANFGSMSFQGMFGSMLANGGDAGSLQDSLSSMGFSLSHFSQSSSGFSLRLGENRNLLNELLEMLDRRAPALPAATEADADEEAEAAPVEEEAAAVAE